MDYQAANEFMAKRLTMLTTRNSREIADSIPPKVRAQCFFSARVAKWRIAKKLKEGADAVARGELSVDEARVHLQRWMDANRIGDKTSTRIGNISSTGRLNLILTQNAKMAAAVGRYQVSRDPDIEERWPCWRYIAGPNPRPAHAVHDGKVYRKSDPFWATHYPPWDFNCNCDVEDSDAPPQTAPRDDGKPPESGYQFDPADAFGTYDLRSIASAWDKQVIREEMEVACGDQIQGTGDRLKFKNRNYSDFQVLKLPDCEKWTEIPLRPPEVPADEARKKLEKGFQLPSADGVQTTMGQSILHHWDIEKNKNEKDINGRLRKLNMAKQTIQKPHEIWQQDTQKTYIALFRKKTGGLQGCAVFVPENGDTRSYFPKGKSGVNSARKGKSCISFGGGGFAKETEAQIAELKENNRKIMEIRGKLQTLLRVAKKNGWKEQEAEIRAMLKHAKVAKYLPGGKGAGD